MTTELTQERPAVGDILRAYGGRLRESADDIAEQPVVSAAGLWLLLASLAPLVVEPESRKRLETTLGLPADKAAEVAGALITDPHPAVAAALGAWLRPDVAVTAALVESLPVPPRPLPDQEQLDQWASEHTRGLVKQFPITITDDSLLVLASALVTQVEWAEHLHEDGDGMLVLDDGLQAVVETEAAGLVAVATPSTHDGVDVVSIIADSRVGAGDVWAAVDEVMEMLDRGSLLDSRSSGLQSGHAWTVREESRRFMQFDPVVGEVWTARLPKWTASATVDLVTAPGVAEVGDALMANVLERNLEVECAQGAAAEYHEQGFSAAAVTAIGVRATGAPMWEQRRVRVVELGFHRPHAVVAVARGGGWEGVPLFSAWVTPGR